MGVLTASATKPTLDNGMLMGTHGSLHLTVKYSSVLLWGLQIVDKISIASFKDRESILKQLV